MHSTLMGMKQKSIVLYDLVEIRDPTLYTNTRKDDMFGKKYLRNDIYCF